MPLYKRKPFPLAENPTDLKPRELVFQVRFTKEIFKDYSEYLKRINLYRQRVWTCKVTGKGNLTYEEALVSEKKASEKVQQFPKELVVPVLREVQFSMLTLRDLLKSINAKMQGRLSEGSEWYGRKNDSVYPCKIIRVLKDSDKTQYEVEWLNKNDKATGNTLINEEDLIKKTPSFNREVLKSFIKESTCRSLPWIVHDDLAKKHGISFDPPEELKDRISVQDGQLVVSNKKRKKDLETNGDEVREHKRNNLGSGVDEGLTSVQSAEGNGKLEEQPIRYPIDDLLVRRSQDDHHLTERPSPCRDFNALMDCMGDLLMVWDFCNSFGRLLHLSPFSLEYFENALCHKDSNVVLVMETHSALLRLLIKDGGEYHDAIQKKKRKAKITLITWRDYLCDFLEMSGLSEHLPTIRRGHYGLLDVRIKVEILKELVIRALETDIVREKLDEWIEERQALAATRRDEALEEGRKRREVKKHPEANGDASVTEQHSPEAAVTNSESANGDHGKENGVLLSKKNSSVLKTHSSHSSQCGQADNETEKQCKKPKVEDPKRAVHKLKKVEIKEAIENRSMEERREYLEREIEKRFIRTNPLGKDRNYSRYWFFRRDARIFVESPDSLQWGYYQTKEELDALMGSLNLKGVRERALKKQLEKFYNKMCSQFQKRSKELALRDSTEDAELRRSTRVRAPPRDNPALAFRKYVNKWKED